MIGRRSFLGGLTALGVPVKWTHEIIPMTQLELPSKFQMVPIESIKVNPHAHRGLSNKALDWLKTDIREIGIKNPITVHELEGGLYNLVDGLHRLEVARILGMKKVPIKIVPPLGPIEVHVSIIQFQPSPTKLVENLKKSIKEIGIIHPILLTPCGYGSGYIIVDGAARVEAVRQLGQELIPATFRNMTHSQINEYRDLQSYKYVSEKRSHRKGEIVVNFNESQMNSIKEDILERLKTELSRRGRNCV